MASSGWVAKETSDGVAFYENTETGETTWDKPDALKTSGEQDLGGTWVWMPHDVDGYVPAKLVQQNPSGSTSVQTEDGTIHEISKKKTVLPLSRRDLRKNFDDLVQMDSIDEGTIVHNLRERFKKDIFYTSIGTILIVVNPFKWLPIYTPEIKKQYFNKGFRQLPPHIYDIADAALRAMMDGGSGAHKANQSILISGESGAGKTEATKQVLDYLAKTAGSVGNIEQKILVANPVLEAFGNAKTIRNDNSSRFGKWVEIFFDDRWRIVGGQVTNYLLEKTRVVRQSRGERNYHIFYMLLKGASAAQRQKFSLGQPRDYWYCNSGETLEADTINDVENYHEMLEAMNTLGFTEEEVDRVLALVAGLLHMGALQFSPLKDGAASAVKNKDVLALAARLFMVNPADLERTLTNRTFRASQREQLSIPLTPEKAADNRDALAKALYGNMFQWLVGKINRFIAPENTSNLMFIGVLDIFGFEIFEKNSFEQLCINFANEKLQQHFNRHTFKLEEQLYQSEQINFQHVEFIDNQPCLDLIEQKPGGVLSILDEEQVVPKGCDAGFLDKLHTRHNQKHERYARPIKIHNAFSIKHYAGEVVYDVNGFLEKNRDTIEEDLLNLIQTSRDDFVRMLFPEISTQARKASLGTQFRTQLASLMDTLNATFPHYVRCVKPNAQKRSGRFDGHMSLLQLRYSGVFEAVRIRQSGYPFRLRHQEFACRYQCLASKKVRAAGTPQQICRAILQEIKGDMSEIQIGLTRVLYRAGSHRTLELGRSKAVWASTVVIQAFVRGVRARVLYRRMKEVDGILKAAIASRDLAKLEAVLEMCKGIWFQLRSMVEAKRLREVILEEREVAKLAKSLVDAARVDPERNYEQIMGVLRRAEKIGFENADIVSVKASVRTIRDRRETLANLKTGADNFDRAMLEAAIAKAEALGIGAADVARARQVLQVIQREESLVARLEGIIKGDPAVIDGLARALEEGRALPIRTPRGKLLSQAGAATLDLRRALAAQNYDEVRRLLDACSVLHPNMSAPELQAIKHGLHMREKMTAAAEKLAEARQTVDYPVVQAAVEACRALEMHSSPWSSWKKEVEEADKFLIQFKKIVSNLTRASASDTPANTSLLKQTLPEATAFGFRVQADVDLVALCVVLLALRTSLHTKNWVELARAVNEAEMKAVGNEEVDRARAGLMLRGRMEKVAGRIADHIEDRNLPELSNDADEATALDMSGSFWSSWASSVAQAAEAIRRHRGVLLALTTGMAARDDSTGVGLRATIVDAQNFGLKTDPDMKLLGDAVAVYDVRAATSGRIWPALATAVTRAQLRGLSTHEDVEHATTGLKLRAQMEETISTIQRAIDGRDAAVLKAGLDMAGRLDMIGSYWSDWAGAVREAQGFHAKHVAVVQALQIALAGDSPEQTEALHSALEDAHRHQLKVPADVALQTRGRVTLRIRRAIMRRAWEQLQQAVDDAANSGVDTGEVRNAVDGLALRAKFDRQVEAMNAAVEARDGARLGEEIRMAVAAGMETSPWSSHHAPLGKAQAFHTKHTLIIARIKEGLAIDAPGTNTTLSVALAEAKTHEFKLPDDLELEQHGRVTLALRRALVMRDPTRIAPTLARADAIGFSTPEIVAAKAGMALRAEMEVTATRLKGAVDARELTSVQSLLEEARRLEMTTSTWSSWADLVHEAEEVARHHVKIVREMTAGLAGTSQRATASLRVAAAEAKGFGFQMDEDVRLYSIARATLALREARAIPDYALLERVVTKALAAGLDSIEISAMKQGLTLRANIGALGEQMATALKGGDMVTLKTLTEEAERMGMGGSPWSPCPALFVSAQTRLRRHSELTKRFRQGLAINLPRNNALLVKAIEDAKKPEFAFSSPADVELLHLAEGTVALRAAMPTRDYDAMAAAVALAKGAHNEELDEVAEGLELRARMGKLATLLDQAMAKRRVHRIEALLEQAARLDMARSPWSSWGEKMHAARSVLAEHRRLLELLANGASSESVANNAVLAATIPVAEAFKFTATRDLAALDFSKAILHMRRMLDAADWPRIASALDRASAAFAKLDGLRQRPDEDSESESTGPPTLPVRPPEEPVELQTARAGLARRVALMTLADQLDAAVKARDPTALLDGIAQAHALQMEEKGRYNEWMPSLMRAETLLARQRAVANELRASIISNSAAATSNLASHLIECETLYGEMVTPTPSARTGLLWLFGSPSGLRLVGQHLLELRRAVEAQNFTALPGIIAKCESVGMGALAPAGTEPLVAATAKAAEMEISEAKQGLESRVRMKVIVDRLVPPTELFDGVALAAVLVDAHALEMESSIWSSWRDQIKRAEELQSSLAEMNRLMELGINFMDEDAIMEAAAIADRINHPDTDEVAGLRRLKEQVSWIHKAADEALSLLWPELLNKVDKRAKQIGLQTPYTERVAYELAAMQTSTVAERFIEPVPPMLLESLSGAKFSFRGCRNMRHPNEYVAPGKKPLNLTGPELAQAWQEMISYTKSPPTSMTRLGQEDITVALQFATQVSNHLAGKTDIIARLPSLSSFHEGLRDEFYCQLIRAVTNNPSESATTRAWGLIAAAVKSFRPSDHFVVYLEWFLREQSPPSMNLLTDLAVTYWVPHATEVHARAESAQADYRLAQIQAAEAARAQAQAEAMAASQANVAAANAIAAANARSQPAAPPPSRTPAASVSEGTRPPSASVSAPARAPSASVSGYALPSAQPSVSVPPAPINTSALAAAYGVPGAMTTGGDAAGRASSAPKRDIVDIMFDQF